MSLLFSQKFHACVPPSTLVVQSREEGQTVRQTVGCCCKVLSLCWGTGCLQVSQWTAVSGQHAVQPADHNCVPGILAPTAHFTVRLKLNRGSLPSLQLDETCVHAHKRHSFLLLLSTNLLLHHKILFGSLCGLLCNVCQNGSLFYMYSFIAPLLGFSDLPALCCRQQKHHQVVKKQQWGVRGGG